MTESKKKWRKPELVVLMRSRSEEAVLVACKGSPYTPEAPPYYSVSYCLTKFTCVGECVTVAGS